MPSNTAVDAKSPMESGHHELAPGMANTDISKRPEEEDIIAEISEKDVTSFEKGDDEAMQAFAKYQGPPLILDEETNARLLRKIDWCLMPILCFVFGLNYLDKTTLSYASVMGIKKDIGLKGDEYQWLGSIFYIGFLVSEYPTNRLLQRLPIAKYSAFCITSWGLVLTLFSVVRNFPGAVAIRLLLGIFEAASMPAFALLSSQWYTVHEHNLRTGIWIGSNGWGQIFGGLIAYGIAKGTSSHEAALAGWKIMFLVIGLFTVVIGLLFFWFIPDSQLNCRWLNERDRLLAIERVRKNEQGIGNKYFKWYQFREAFTDPMTWALFAYGVLSDIPNGGLTNFFSLLITSFGYTSEQSLLYAIPGGAVVIIVCLTNGWAGERFHNRALVACGPMICAFTGMLLIVALPINHNANIGRLIGYYMTQANPATGATVLSLISSNVAGYTKKTTVAAFYLIGYAAGNIIGPQTFRPKNAPRYVPAEITIMICYALCACDLIFISWWCHRENRRKAAVRASSGYVRLENHGWRDLTDRENPEFNYTL